jgi:hypothetical protein
MKKLYIVALTAALMQIGNVAATTSSTVNNPQQQQTGQNVSVGGSAGSVNVGQTSLQGSENTSSASSSFGLKLGMPGF